MKVLLDTHTFMWWDSQPGKLSGPVLQVLHDPTNLVFLSVASVWEIIIKQQLGKLALHTTLATIIAQQQVNGLQILDVTLDHVFSVQSLPPIHKDPFDRLLIAQAIAESATLLTVDPIFAQYQVTVPW